MAIRVKYRLVAILALALPFLVIGLKFGLQWSGCSMGGVNMIKVGDLAPDVALHDTGLEAVTRLSDLRGKKNVVLAFYPKAFTPHCTQQMCGYRDAIQAFRDADTELISVSLDTPEKSRAFKEKYNLNFAVIGDTNRAIVNAFGVPVLNLLFARMAKRSVFLIDKEGAVRYVNRSYNVGRDAETLLEHVQSLHRGVPTS